MNMNPQCTLQIKTNLGPKSSPLNKKDSYKQSMTDSGTEKHETS